MTAAVAASKLQASVTVFERHSNFLHNLQGCHTRHLHPNIYDWPNMGSLLDSTNLPFMNWSAATADVVSARLLEEWNVHVQVHKIILRPNSSVMIRKPSPDGTRRITVASGKDKESNFDIVILAVGFGLERTVVPQPLRSYWRDDSLHQPEIEIRESPTKYLVSGNGDGGLIDILRIRLVDFRQENLLKDFSDIAKLENVIQKLNEIEDSVRSAASTGKDPGDIIHFGYDSLQVPSEFDSHLEGRLRQDTTVIFNYEDWPFSHKSSVFHRFLVSRLLKIDSNTSTLAGTLVEIDGHEPNLVGRFRTDSGDIERLFNRAVVRHGPQSAIGRDFPLSDQRFEPILRARNALDSTRIKLWPDGFFGPATTQALPIPQAINQISADLEVSYSVEGTSSIDEIGPDARAVRDSLLNGTSLYTSRQAAPGVLKKLFTFNDLPRPL